MSSSTCSLCHFWQSSIGKKIVVALTGAYLVFFLAGHLVGNMLIYQSSEAFNHYAEFLHTMLHGWGIWIFRIIMLVALALHIIATIQLTAANRASRPSRYQHDATMVASRSSRMMIWSGLTVLVFFVFHILHYTVRVQEDLQASSQNFKQNWAMTIAGFQNLLRRSILHSLPWPCCAHILSHGVASIFQTLGLRTKKTAPAVQLFSKAYSIIIFVGFISIPISVYFFGYGKKEMEATKAMVEAKADAWPSRTIPSRSH